MRFKGYLTNSNLAFVVWTASAAFITYFSMYAFRKPLTAGTFDGLMLWGISYKALLVITQVLGYLTSKLLGIKIIAELDNKKRFRLLIGLIAISELALVLFAITPYPYGFVWVFFNGLPLGLIWGIVFSYIEGRRFTDVLATFLSISFIVSSGIVKTLGRLLVEQFGVSEFWMPALVGLCFFPLLWIAGKMLEAVPPPSNEDRELRAERVPMQADQRKRLFRSYALGLSAILLVNFVLTIARDIKDNFMVEIWYGAGVDTTPYIFSQVETLVGVLVLVLLSLLVFIKNNNKAFFILHLSMFLGLLVSVGATWFYQRGTFGPVWWMILHGVGLYLAYIAFQSLYFERFIATFSIKGNVGFLIYLSDFIGYLGSCAILMIKELSGIQVNWTVFFIWLTYAVGGIGLLGVIIAQLYFSIKQRNLPTKEQLDFAEQG